MSRCAHWQELFGEALYGDLTAESRQKLDQHLASCPECAREYRQLEATVELLRREPLAPEPAALDQVWERLAPQLDQQDRAEAWRWRRSRSWILQGLAAAAVLLTALGVALWQHWPATQAPAHLVESQPLHAPDRNLELRAAYDQYLDRATPLILAIANRDPNPPSLEGFDLDAERQLARRLADDAQRLSERLEEGSRLGREQDLLAELEVVFLQISNLYRRQYSDGIELLRSGLDQRSILFQLSVEEIRRQAAEPDPSV